MQYCYFTYLYCYDRIWTVKKITNHLYKTNIRLTTKKKEVRKWKTTNYVWKSSR